MYQVEGVQSFLSHVDSAGSVRVKLREKISENIIKKLNYLIILFLVLDPYENEYVVIFHIFGIFWVGGACQHPLSPKSAKIQKNHTFTQNSLF